MTDLPIEPAALVPETVTLTPNWLEFYYLEVDGQPMIGIALTDPKLGPFAVELPEHAALHVAKTIAAMIGTERDRLGQAWQRDFGGRV